MKKWFIKKEKYSLSAKPVSWQAWTLLIVMIIAIFRIVSNLSEHLLGGLSMFVLVYFVYWVISSSTSDLGKVEDFSSEKTISSWRNEKLGMKHFIVGISMILIIVLSGLVIAYIEAILLS